LLLSSAYIARWHLASPRSASSGWNAPRALQGAMANGAGPAMEPSLQNIIDQKSLKWIFVGGKGGVGKTTTSCSLAIQLAKNRNKVLIISTDPAHNLSDAFRQKFNRHPSLINGFNNLYAMEVDPNAPDSELEGLGEEGSFFADLAGSIPGIDEAVSFAEVMKQVQSMDYDCIVFDTAPTGHTLRLLQFPSTLQKALDKLTGLKGSFGGILQQAMSLFGGSAPGEDDLMGKFEQMKDIVTKVNNQFRDPNLTTFVCVCIPEFLSLYETERLVQELAKFEIDCRNIVINQVLFPEKEHKSRLLEARVRMQQKYLDQFYELYEDFYITRMPLQSEEVRGSDKLEPFSGMLVQPFVPTEDVMDGPGQISAMEKEIADLRAKVKA